MKYILLLFLVVQLGATGQTGSVKVSQGGTGANTAQRARINILPSMTGNSLKVLRVNTGETDYELATVSSGSGSGLLHFVAGNGLVQINDSTARLDTSWSDGALTLKMAKKKFDSTSVLYGHLASANTWALDQTVPDEAYDATSWNGSLEVPTKNAVRDKIESISGGSSWIGTYTNTTTGSFVGATLSNADNTLLVHTGGAGTMTLCTMAQAGSKVMHIVNDGSGTLTISRQGTDQISYQGALVNSFNIEVGRSFSIAVQNGHWLIYFDGYNPTAGSGITEEQSEDYTGAMFATDNGDIDFTYNDGTPDIAASIKSSAVTLAKIANIADQTILGNNTGGSAAPVALTASQTRTLLGLVIGTNVQAWDADLDTWAGITPGSNVGTFLATPSSANLRSALTDESGTGVALFNGATSPDFTTGFTIGTAAANGKFIVGNGTNYIASTSTIPTSAGTAGKILVSDGTNYILSTPTFPNASATSGKMIKSDGTNWVASTETYAAPSTSGNIMQSDGTNWTSSTNTGGWTVLKVAGSNVTNNTTSLADITGLVSATLSTATLYEFEAVLYVNSSSTAGMQIAIDQTGTGSGQIGVFSGTATSAAATALAIGSNALATSAAACVLVNGDGTITVRGYIKTGSSGSPTIKLRFLKTTSGTATVYIGSTMRFKAA